MNVLSYYPYTHRNHQHFNAFMYRSVHVGFLLYVMYFFMHYMLVIKVIVYHYIFGGFFSINDKKVWQQHHTSISIPPMGEDWVIHIRRRCCFHVAKLSRMKLTLHKISSLNRPMASDIFAIFYATVSMSFNILIYYTLLWCPCSHVCASKCVSMHRVCTTILELTLKCFSIFPSTYNATARFLRIFGSNFRWQLPGFFSGWCAFSKSDVNLNPQPFFSGARHSPLFLKYIFPK